MRVAHRTYSLLPFWTASLTKSSRSQRKLEFNIKVWQKIWFNAESVTRWIDSANKLAHCIRQDWTALILRCSYRKLTCGRPPLDKMFRPF